MKIEKISDTQIKFIFSKNDLIDRNIKLEELVTPNEKAQKLFHDIMEQAMNEFGMSKDDAPIMVEAVPVAMDGIMIIVTRINAENKAEIQGRSPASIQEYHRYKKVPVKPYVSQEKAYQNISIFSFHCLDDSLAACSEANSHYYGESSFYFYNNTYFLVLQSDRENSEESDMFFSEYGKKHTATNLSKYYLLEHGQELIASSAVEKLASSI